LFIVQETDTFKESWFCEDVSKCEKWITAIREELDSVKDKEVRKIEKKNEKGNWFEMGV
jgi:hypothetical protein